MNVEKSRILTGPELLQNYSPQSVDNLASASARTPFRPRRGSKTRQTCKQQTCSTGQWNWGQISSESHELYKAFVRTSGVCDGEGRDRRTEGQDAGFEIRVIVINRDGVAGNDSVIQA